MSQVLARAIEPLLAPGGLPVLILEGARAVGKTTTARALLAAGQYASYSNLADPAELAFATADPRAWLAGLAQPAIIDEAQLLGELPLLLKVLLDEPDAHRRYLLTGSAAIGRAGLGGADPLTGRSVRYRLDPMTAAELNRDPQWCRDLVPRLLAADLPATVRQLPALDTSVADLIATGGFPVLALRDFGRDERARLIEATIVSTLTDHVLPDERYDYLSARRVLDACLANPGGILNVAALSNRLSLNVRTVDRYLDVLERRFLLHHLPNLAANEHRQARSRAKVHPVDSAFSAERLADAGSPVESHPEALGRVLESYVVNQILASAAATGQRVRAWYWRDAKRNLEVDLVLVDAAERAIGIEVKAASSVGPEDFRGLRALGRTRELAAGYVVYTGDRIIPVADRLWALPLTFLARAPG